MFSFSKISMMNSYQGVESCAQEINTWSTPA